MPDYKYLIVGGGMTAAAAVEGIREKDANGTIGIISAETHPPYNRPPLSKGLWKGKLDQRLRAEHEDNANTMGKLAGQAMAGKKVTYDHLPFFYSDLFDLGYEAVGETDSRLETVIDWKEPLHEGVIYYLKESRVRGVLLWNVWEQVDAARQLIAEPGPFDAESLKRRLPT